MSFSSHLIDSVGMLSAYGELISVQYYSEEHNPDGYDDDVMFLQSGNTLWVSGLVQPLDVRQGSREALLVQEGRLQREDLRLYVSGTLNLSQQTKIGIGSPARDYFKIVDLGVNQWSSEGSVIYEKIYLSRLTSGKLPGE